VNNLNEHTGALIRKLESTFVLSDSERAVLTRLPMSLAQLRRDQDIVRDGDRPTRSCVLLEGFAFRYKTTAKGERQILSFHIPGEIPDLQSLHIHKMDHSLAALTPCKVGFVEHEEIQRLVESFPRIGAALWRETLIDAAIFRQWMLGLGRKDAAPRVAHLLCEMFDRMNAVGLAKGDSCPLPITQAELADALGLSGVHINRTLQELRRQGLIALSKGSLTIKDQTALRTLGDYDPAYLHQEPWKAA
jgi:CRP-like cAMP-binding protein